MQDLSKDWVTLDREDMRREEEMLLRAGERE